MNQPTVNEILRAIQTARTVKHWGNSEYEVACSILNVKTVRNFYKTYRDVEDNYVYLIYGQEGEWFV